MKVLGIIPARYVSSRFPGKPLAMIAGKSMIERVYRRAEKAKTLDDIVVATDDQRIAGRVREFGGKVIMTAADCPTGTDRTALVAEVMEDYDIVLNIQGDEPLLEPGHIDTAVELIERTPEADITTLVRPARYPGEADDYNCVKVVLGTDGRILYFSRGRVPYCRDKDLQSKFEPGGENPYRIHIGLYVYRREKLLKMVGLPTVMAERCEGLEQLRALDSGITMYAAQVSQTTSIGVDTPDDIILVEKAIKEHGLE